MPLPSQTVRSLLALAAATLATLSLFALGNQSEDRGPTLEQVLPAEEVKRMARVLEPFELAKETGIVVLEGTGAAWGEARIEALVRDLEGLEDVGSVRIARELEATLTDPGLRLLLLDLTPESRGLERAKGLSASLKEVLGAAKRPGERAYALGRSRLRAESWRLARSDLSALLPILLVLALGIPWLFLGSLRAGLLALVVAACTTAATLWGYRVMWGPPGALALLVIPLLWAVSTMDVLHLVSSAGDRRGKGVTPAERLRKARKELLAPCLVTSLTTAAGLGTLGLLGRSGFLSGIGIACAAGVLLAYGFTFVLGPPLLRLVPARTQPRWPYALALPVMRSARSRPRAWVGGWLVILLIAMVGLGRVQVAGAFPRVFDEEVEVQADLEHLSRVLGSDLAPVELLLSASDEAGAEALPLMSAVVVLARELASLPGVRLVLPFDASHPRDLEESIPGLATSHGSHPRDREHALEEFLESKELRPWIAADRSGARLQVHLAPGTWGERRRFVDRVMRFDRSMLSHHEISFAGPGHAAFEVERLGLEDLRRGGLLSLLLLGVVLSLGLRRSQGGAAMWPLACAVSVLPLLLTVGVLGWVGEPWSLSLIPLPGVLLGISVDDSVHLLWRTRGPRRLRALPAILATTAVVAACLCTLTTTSMIANRVFGKYLVLGLCLALVADLTLLPACLRLSRRRAPGSSP